MNDGEAEMSEHSDAPHAEQDEWADLPPPNTTRWVARRKAQVAQAVQLGRLTADDACEIYGLTLEELAGWQRAYGRFGLRGLQATRRPIERMAFFGTAVDSKDLPWITRHA